MSEIYNEAYYRNYDVGIGKVEYATSEYTKGCLEKIAEQIVNDLHPKTVLDAGCAMGHLVAALRDRGVEAYGIDISEYAISKVREDIRPFCAAGSLTEPLPEPLPKHYDLVVTNEVLEHLYEEEGKAAIRNLCSYADRIIFSSTPDALAEPTHVNVQQREYWAKLFAAQGFFDDINYRPLYLTKYASCFCRSENWVRQVEDYERNIRLTETEREMREAYWSKAVEDKERHIQNQNAMIADAQKAEKQAAEQLQKLTVKLENAEKELAKKQKNEENLKGELAHYKEHYAAAIEQREELKRQLAVSRNAYQVISNAACWKMTKPLRVLLDILKYPFRHSRMLLLCRKGFRCLRENGFRYTWKKVLDKFKHHQSYQGLAQKSLFTEEELERQRNTKFPKQVKFSVLVPLYNTPEKFLHEMIQSVLDQTYGNWELCLADGSDKQHSSVGHICMQYAQKEPRIHYQKLEKNLGISGNTNACIDMASGDYIALFDHDALLHPAALYEMMRAICEQSADFIYTDENTFHKTPEDAFYPQFKPDYAPDTLRSYNYICHFTAFSRELLDKIGEGFRSEFDGSQDYDMVLRLTEQAQKIVHIPEILYYWRSHANSVASDVSAKPYTIVAAKKALAEHLERCGLKGTVMDSTIPSTYKIAYEIEGKPLVSILIPNKDHIDDLNKCIQSILQKSTYTAFEIIIIENNSTEAETFAYYDRIQTDERIRVVYWEKEFNYSAITNFGAREAKGDYLLLLNNDVEVITPDWMEQMLMFAQRKDVGAVGVMLYYPDETVQHGGVVVGLGGVAGHSHKNFRRKDSGYMYRLTIAQNYSAVTAACVIIRRDVWNAVQGLDEAFKVAFNDVDLCMRIRKAGYLIVWTPYAELYHYESKSRGYDDTPEKQERFIGEVRRFQSRWVKELAAGDPYYNPNLTITREDFSLKED